MFKRIARSTVLATALIALTAGATFAHECYNASRSAQGNAGATKSAVWETAEVGEVFSFITFVYDGLREPLSPDGQAAATQAAIAAGVPAEATLFFGPITIGGNGKAFTDGGKASDGRGIDHFFAAFETELRAAYWVGYAVDHPAE